MIPGNANPLLLASAAADAAAAGPIKSVRFNSGDSAYLNRTPSSSGNRKTWTYSVWVKRSELNTSKIFRFWSAGVTQQDSIYFNTNDTLQVYLYGGSGDANTLAVFRDTSAWYHIVLSVDTTQATTADRIRIYVNGEDRTNYVACTQNLDCSTNLNALHTISTLSDSPYAGANPFDGYLADAYLIDGQALGPTSFGAFDDSGVWQAAAYSGTFGTNGFHLFDFANESGIGDDSSGNDNDFTANNFTALGPAATQFKVYGNASTSGSSSTINVSSLTTLQGTNVSTYNIGGTNYNHLTADLGSVGTHAIQARTYLNIGTDILVFVSNNGSSWSSISNQQDPYIFTGRYIQWVRTSQGYDNQVLTAVDAGKETDVLRDVPTNGDSSDDTGAGGEVSGNYATFNALDASSDFTLSNGNLDLTTSAANNWEAVRATIGVSSGKYYWEWTAGVSRTDIGVSTAQMSLGNWVGSGAYGWSYDYNGQKYNNGSGSSYGNSYTTGDVIGVAFDADAGNLYFYKNGVAQNSGTAAFTGLTSGPYFPAFSTNETGGTNSVNFGQRAFAYSAPSGFSPLCTTLLPTPTIADGSDNFETLTWTGDGTGSRSFTGLTFQPDFTWAKIRTQAYTHTLFDAVRGAGSSKELQSDSTNAEGGASTNVSGYLSAFNSDGFSSTAGSSDNDYFNKTGNTYVAWNWNAGANSSKTYTVKVVSDSGNKYRFDDFGTSAVTLDLEEGSTYVFDQSDSSNSGHPLRFSTTSDGTHNSGTEYTTGVTTTGTPGSAGAKTTIVVAASAPTLYYYCSAHSGMGGQANTNSTAGASNFDGSIQTTVRANQDAGFSIVSYIGSGANATIGHGLNAAPEFAIFKARNGTNHWLVYHKSIGNDKKVNLNLNDAASSSSTSFFQSTDPTSSVMYLGTESSGNWSGYNMIGYLFSSVEGYSSFGSYEGNGSSDGPFIYTGFRPAFFLLKSIDSGQYWYLADTSRSPVNDGSLEGLWANATSAEFSYNIDILSNGFKINQYSANFNASGVTFIYIAFAENPFSSNGGLAR